MFNPEAEEVKEALVPEVAIKSSTIKTFCPCFIAFIFYYGLTLILIK